MARSTYKLSATRTFGIEIEAYGVARETVCQALNDAGIICRILGYDHSTVSYWKLVSDSSIHGEHAFELVSPPLAGTEGIAQVETVCRVLNTLGVQVNKSCGLHVHHDANDLTLAHWRSLAKYWLKYEETLDTLVPESRRIGQNRYCAALRSRFTSIADAFTAIDRATTVHGLADILCNSNRYYTLNLTAFWQHGTVEVRMHSGTIDAEKILHWVSLTQCLVVRAMESGSVATRGTDLNAVTGATCVSRRTWTSKVSTATVSFYQTRQAALAGI